MPKTIICGSSFSIVFNKIYCFPSSVLEKTNSSRPVSFKLLDSILIGYMFSKYKIKKIF